VPQRGKKPPAQPPPYTAQRPHHDWVIDGRQMAGALEGVQWWSLLR